MIQSLRNRRRGGALGRLGFAAALAAAALLRPGPPLAAQEEGPPPGERVVIVYEEPRHRVVVDSGDYKVLDVQILPGDTTLWHRHDSPIMYTFISLGNGSANGRISSNTDYLAEPYTHEVTNSGSGLFRIIALASYLPARSDLSAGRPAALSGEPQLENPWFRSYRLELDPGETTPMHEHVNPAVIVQVSDGAVDVLRDDGFGDQIRREGNFAFQEAGRPYRVQNAGDAPVSVVINEVRANR